MKVATVWILFLFIVAIIIPEIDASGSPKEITNTTRAKHTLLGSALTPAHIPQSTPKDFENYFNLAAEIGSHVTFMPAWEEDTPLETIRSAIAAARAHGLAFHLFLGSTKLSDGRKEASLPPALAKRNFADDLVREAFKRKMLEWASLKPDILGMGTEINLLVQNPPEFKAFATLARETYKAVKEEYPAQTMTVSFQWDVIITQKQFDVLPQFSESLDVYSLTSYPSFFKAVDKMPAEYYSAVRKLLPTQRLGFSEIGWNSKADSNEELQAAYYAKLPQLMKDAHPEFVTLALMHDVSAFSAELAILNSVGIRTSEGSPKPSWNVVKNLKF